jgi:hypothetical protein
MQINWNKSYFMVFSNKRMKQPPHVACIETSDFKILRVSQFKYLGIWIDEHLSFEAHVNQIIKKVTPRINYLLRLKRFIPPEKFPTVFNAIVMSCLEYGIQVWGGASKILINRVQKVINNFFKRLTSPIQCDVDEMHERFKILKIDEYSNYYLSLFAKLYTADYVMPVQLKDFVTLHENEHDTRSSNCFVVPTHKTVLFESSVKYRLVKFWNNLDNEVKECKSFQSLKYLLSSHLVKSRS